MTEQPNREVAVLNAALELHPAERAAYLDEACAGDATLRQQVEALLRADAAAEGFLEAPPAGPGLASTVRVTAALTEKPGDRIGHYKLLQQIGEGGCGVVYMAEQEEPVRRRVALKVIKLGMDTKQVVARFEAERQALALMDHPNIAKIFEAGITERPLTPSLSPADGERVQKAGEGEATRHSPLATHYGRPYFVMELVRGIKITDFCDENNVSTADRLKLFVQVCQAIQHAHQKGIIHRDIKPSNILVTVNDGVPVPKVIDFGIAKATQGRLTDQTLFTAFEQFIGTPAYMSPEQAVMTSLDIDTRSDIYSLGVLLYELLTGKTPFDQQELLAAGLDEMRRTIREKEPPKPSTRLTQELVAADVRRLKSRSLSSEVRGQPEEGASSRRLLQMKELIHALRGDLDWIVMKCLEKDRARRYETANGVATDILRHLNCEPVIARPPSRLYEFQKTVRRHKFGFAAAAALIAVLAVGLLASTWEAARARRAERDQSRLRLQAQAQQKKAQTEAGKSKQVAGFLKQMLQGVGPSKALGRDTTMLREILDKTAENVGKELTNQPEVEVELRLTLGETYFELGLYEQMEAMARRSLQVARAGLGEENRSVAISLVYVGDALFHLGKFGEAEAKYREALAMERKLLGNEHLDVANSLDHLAEALNYEGKLPEAEATLRQALAIRRKLSGDQDPNAAATLASLAHVLWEEGKLADVERLGGDVLAARTNLLGSTNLATASSLIHLARLCSEQDKEGEAEAMLREALAIQKKSLGSEHPDVVNTLNELGILLQGEGQLTQAETIFREVLALQRKLLGDKHPEAEGWIFNLAQVLRQEGKLGELETLYRESLAKRRKLFGDEHPEVVASLEQLVILLVDEGKGAEAEALCHGELRPALARFNALVRADPRRCDLAIQIGHWQWRLAEVLSQTGRSGQAEPVLREALGLFEQAATDFPTQLFPRQEEAYSRRQLSDTLVKLGRVDEGEREDRAAIALYAELKAAAPTNAFFFREEAYTAWMLGKMLQGTGRGEAAAIEYRRAIALHQAASAVFPDDTELKERLARLLDEQGAFAGVQGAYHLALAQYRKNAEGGDLKHLNALAWFLATCPDSTVRDGQAALELAKQAVATSNHAEENYLDTLAAAYAATGQFADAVRIEKEAVKLLRPDQGESSKEFAAHLKVYESGSPYLQSDEQADTAAALQSLADLRSQEGKLAEAEALYRQALAIRKKLLGSEDPATAGSAHNLADALNRENKLAEAETLYREALAARQKTLGPQDLSTLGSIHNLGDLLTKQGKLAEAEALRREELASKKKGGASKASVLETLNSLADLLRSQHKDAEAKALIEGPSADATEKKSEPR